MNFHLTAVGEDGSPVKITPDVRTADGLTSISVRFDEAARVREIVLWDGEMMWRETDRYYGDGYQMLTRYEGTVGKIRASTWFTDAGHYKMPQESGFHTSYDYIYVKTEKGYHLIGATSGRRFRAEFRSKGMRLKIVQCLEDLSFSAGETVQLEGIAEFFGEDLQQLLSRFADAIEVNHPRRVYPEIPVGWCSWYCCGPAVTEEMIFENLKRIKTTFPEFKFIQIDDGYQPFMGDWLEVGNKFGRPMKDICLDIKREGFEPAIWIAPFIVSPGSRIFREHPDWLIADEDGKPLCAQDVTFKGWRDAPWYFLDLTHPDAWNYIRDVCRTMREEWGVKYYKLDANMWGALPFGIRHRRDVTAMEAYRIGMDAVWAGAGEDSFILGCNAPMWASLGTVSGMRVTGDAQRTKRAVRGLIHECFPRNWMHGRLWINDPDCVLMAGTSAEVIDGKGDVTKTVRMSRSMFEYQNVYVKASGGVLLSGDYISKLTERDVRFLKLMIRDQGEAAQFNDDLTFGTIRNADSTDYFLFNHARIPKKMRVDIREDVLTDMYTGAPVQTEENKLTIWMRPLSGKWFRGTDK